MRSHDQAEEPASLRYTFAFRWSCSWPDSLELDKQFSFTPRPTPLLLLILLILRRRGTALAVESGVRDYICIYIYLFRNKKRSWASDPRSSTQLMQDGSPATLLLSRHHKFNSCN